MGEALKSERSAFTGGHFMLELTFVSVGMTVILPCDLVIYANKMNCIAVKDITMSVCEGG